MTSMRSTLFTLVAALLILGLPLNAVGADRNPPGRMVFAADSVPFGMTYGDWAAAWWQYIFSFSASTSPAVDSTGASCGLGQSAGPVFFLNPSFFSGVLVTRTCTVPAGKALWLPIVLNECSTVEPPPSHGDDPRDLRQCAALISDGIGPETVKLTIDDVRTRDLRNFRTVSPLFDFTLPATDNLLGLDGVTSASSISDGYSVMIKPLSPGTHVIHAEGDFVSGPSSGLSFAVTYNLTVQ